MAESYERAGAGQIKSVGPSLTFRFRTYVDMRKWLRVLEHITKHFEQASHYATPHPSLDSIGFSYRLNVILDH